MLQLTLFIRGSYPSDVLDSPLRDALVAEIRKHMEGYGMTDVTTGFEVHQTEQPDTTGAPVEPKISRDEARDRRRANAREGTQ
jgi:hypothetical protein